MKISTFVISLILVGMVATVFGLYFSEGATKYGAEYDNATFDGMDRTSSIQTQMEQINQSLSNLNPTSNPLDVLGGFMSSGYSVIKVTFQSFGLFTDMSNTAFSKVSALTILKPYLITIALVVFIFIIISIIVNRDT